MKKLLVTILCLAFAWNALADVRSLPSWVRMTFTNAELKRMPEAKRIWNGNIEEDGKFFSGEGKSEFAAELEAVANIITDSVCIKTSEDGYFSESVSMIADPSEFVRTVDKYVADDGMVFVLVFISNTDRRNLLRNSLDLQKIDGIWAVVTRTDDENKFTEEIKFIRIINRERN